MLYAIFGKEYFANQAFRKPKAEIGTTPQKAKQFVCGRWLKPPMKKPLCGLLKLQLTGFKNCRLHYQFKIYKKIKKAITYKIKIIKGNVPSKSNCYKIITLSGHGSLAKTKALKDYEESFMWQCGKYRNANISNPFEFHVDVYYPSKRSDLDNAMKIILDCLQKVKAISNDNLCCKIVAQKFIDKENARIEFLIKEA